MVRRVIDKCLAVFVYSFRFKEFGRHSVVRNPLKREGMRNISIGNDVFINSHTWLASLPLTGYECPLLRFGDGTVIGNYNHIYATREIVFEDNVLTADKVYIADNQHLYEDIDTPVLHQTIRQLVPIRIGEGSWLGENVCVIGASIGKHCVIGANSVVTKDIPDYCVAVGTPARVIKRYDFEKKEWVRV